MTRQEHPGVGINRSAHKRIGLRYQSDRSPDWLEAKNPTAPGGPATDRNIESGDAATLTQMIPRSKYLGKRIGDPPQDEAEHFIRCPAAERFEERGRDHHRIQVGSTITGMSLTMRPTDRSPNWLKFKNQAAPAARREAEEDWGRR